MSPPAVDDLEQIAAPAARRADGYSYFVAGFLGLVYTFNFLDRQFLTVLAEPVRKELHLSDTQLGMLTGLMFALFYTICGIPVAALADRTNRVRVMAAACGLWSLFTALCGLATGFVTLATARIGVGVGEAGGSAPSYSIIADYFPPEQRGTGLAIYSLGVPLGTIVGAWSGGWIAAHYGWRAAFMTLGLAGVILAPLIPLVVREPVRGRMDAPVRTVEADPAPSIRDAIGYFLGRPALVLTALSAGLTAFVLYGLVNWVPSFLIRARGMDLAQLASAYSLVAGISIGVGTWLGGVLVDRLGTRNPAAYAWIPGLAILSSTPFLFGFTNAADWRVALAFLAVPMVLLNMYLAPALAVMQNGAPPRYRATMGALLLFTLNLIGLGGGPLFVGMVSDAVRSWAGDDSLRIALQCLAPFFLLAVLCQLATARALRRAGSPTNNQESS
jgi:predicted MFS family arabinose efflux permease